MEDIVTSLELQILSITPAIAALAESGIIPQGDPGDRLIAATAIAHQAPLITADKKLHSMTWFALYLVMMVFDRCIFSGIVKFSIHIRYTQLSWAG